MIFVSAAFQHFFCFATEKMEQTQLAGHIGLNNYLRTLLTNERLEKFERVIHQRTRHVTLVTENILEEHNVNAVMRSCECLGVQDVYVINNLKHFKPARKVLQGSHKWLTLNKYDERGSNNTGRCVADLRAKGYKIAVTSFQPDALPLEEINIKHPLAVVFGNEGDGVSEYLLKQADYKLIIPMSGFTSSFNISVSAGIILHHLLYRLKQSGINWQLTPAEKEQVQFGWIRNSLKDFDYLVKYYFEKDGGNNI